MTEQNTQRQKKYKILLLGDRCTDIYQYGDVDRLSPEAPVPVFVPTRREKRRGMAGNVYNNLLALGCEINFLSGYAGTKTRLIDNRSKQQILRLDEDEKCAPIRFDTAIPPCYDAIVISDYEKGSIDYQLIYDILDEASCPVFIDTKKTNLEGFKNAWVKINENESKKLINGCSGLIVTLGSLGAKFQDVYYPSTNVEVSDVTGAGDTFLSALVYKYLETNDIAQSIPFANKASAVTVQHYGVYAPSLEEIL